MLTNDMEPDGKQRLHPAVRLRLARDQIFMGPGAAELLRRIAASGSVRLACQEMGISYSKGWKILRVIEEETGCSAVERQQGGRNGGNASLTAEGKELLERFTAFESRGKEQLQALFDEIFGRAGS